MKINKDMVIASAIGVVVASGVMTITSLAVSKTVSFFKERKEKKAEQKAS
jgi:uncharacterized protein (DUF2062 family)